jgi:glycerophosphoryl diester phosphodiesterase
MSRLSDWLDSAPLVIAHRGASAAAPENTLAAFELAVDLGAEAVELDAKCTLDGEIVCFHDRTLQRTTGASGTLGSRSLDDLHRLDAGRWRGEKFRGEKIPTLSDVLAAVGGRVLVNIELTDYWGDQPRLTAGAVGVVRRHGLERRVLFSSFQSRALRAAESLAPEIPRAHLVGPTWLTYRDRLSQRRASVQAEHPHVSLADPERIDAIHRTGKRVHVYTVDEGEAMDRLWKWGVDGLITNLPDVARARRSQL